MRATMEMSVLSRLCPSSRFRTRASSRTREIASQPHPATSALRAVRDRFNSSKRRAPEPQFFRVEAITKLEPNKFWNFGPSSRLSNCACASEARGWVRTIRRCSPAHHILAWVLCKGDGRSTLFPPSHHHCIAALATSAAPTALVSSQWSVPTLPDCPKAQPVRGWVASMGAVGATYI